MAEFEIEHRGNGSIVEKTVKECETLGKAVDAAVYDSFLLAFPGLTAKVWEACGSEKHFWMELSF